MQQKKEGWMKSEEQQRQAGSHCLSWSSRQVEPLSVLITSDLMVWISYGSQSVLPWRWACTLPKSQREADRGCWGRKNSCSSAWLQPHAKEMSLQIRHTVCELQKWLLLPFQPPNFTYRLSLQPTLTGNTPGRGLQPRRYITSPSINQRVDL